MQIVNNDYILVFASHNQAVFLYNRLIRMGYKVELVSTPCKISAGCTQSVKFKGELISIVSTEAERLKMSVRGIYKIDTSTGKINYIKV